MCSFQPCYTHYIQSPFLQFLGPELEAPIVQSPSAISAVLADPLKAEDDVAQVSSSDESAAPGFANVAQHSIDSSCNASRFSLHTYYQGPEYATSSMTSLPHSVLAPTLTSDNMPVRPTLIRSGAQVGGSYQSTRSDDSITTDNAPVDMPPFSSRMPASQEPKPSPQSQYLLIGVKTEKKLKVDFFQFLADEARGDPSSCQDVFLFTRR